MATGDRLWFKNRLKLNYHFLLKPHKVTQFNSVCETAGLRVKAASLPLQNKNK